MTPATVSAREIYDTALLGSLVRFSDGAPEPPARHRRKRAAWASGNAAGRLVRRTPADHISPPSFMLHLGDFGSGGVTVVRAYNVFSTSSPLRFAILAAPRPGQAAILQDERGIVTLVHLADTAAEAEAWLKAHPHRNARIAAAGAPEPRLFTYLQDPGHGWFIAARADLAAAGMPCADFSLCSYVSGDSFALEEDCDMPAFLQRLDKRGIPHRLREHHTSGDALVRRWPCNSGIAID